MRIVGMDEHTPLIQAIGILYRIAAADTRGINDVIEGRTRTSASSRRSHRRPTTLNEGPPDITSRMTPASNAVASARSTAAYNYSSKD
jgi:hypothetical protein